MANAHERNAEGKDILKPVTNWTVGDVAGVAVLASIEYADSREEFEIGESKTIQLVLTPQQSLHIADELSRLGDRLMRSRLQR